MVLVLCLSWGNRIPVQALEEGVLEYEIVEDSYIVITDCQTSAQGVIDIPEMLLGYPVTGIGAAAFSGCTGITQILVPDGVTEIGEEAFYGCTALQTVELPETVQTLGARVCANCTSLEQISLPDGIDSIGIYAFQNCSSLEQLDLPAGVTVLQQGLLSGCSSLTQLELGAQTTQIASYFAQNNVMLSELTVPDTVTSIGSNAFQGCTALTHVYFDGDAPTVGENCFESHIVLLHYSAQASGWTQPLWNGYQTQMESPPELTGIALSQTALQMEVGEQAELCVLPAPQDAPLGNVVWTSSAPNIVQVQDGVLTAYSVGQATISADAGNFTAQCSVTVTHTTQPQSVVLSVSELSLYAGDSAQLTAQILPESAADADLSWTSSNTQIATVENGMVTAVNCGTAYITASAGTAQAVCTVTVGLHMPELLTTESTCLAVNVRWEPVAGAEGYQILRQSADGEWTALASVSGQQTTSYADTSAVYQSAYFYTVRAYSGGIWSEYDQEGVAGKRQIGQPVLRSAASVDDQTVSVQWDAVPGAEKYRLYRKSGTSNWKLVKEFNGTSYTDTGLTCGTAYTYTVRACWQDKISTYDSTGVSATPVPAAPVLRAAQASVGRVRVSWTAVPRATGYRVYRKTPGATWVRIANVGSNVLQYEDTTAEDGVIYYYTVRACRQIGSTVIAGAYDAAGIAGCTRPQTPHLVSAEALEEGNCIRWNSVAGVDGYQIYRRTEDAGWSRLGVVPASSTSYVDTRAEPGVRYYYMVRGYMDLEDSRLYTDYEEGLAVTTHS